MKFGDKLTALMNRDGINQYQLSKAIGVSHPSVSGWLTGAKPRRLVMARISDFFEVPTAVLEDDSKPLGRYQFPKDFRQHCDTIRETVDQACAVEGKPKEALWEEINNKLTAILEALNGQNNGSEKH